MRYIISSDAVVKISEVIYYRQKRICYGTKDMTLFTLTIPNIFQLQGASLKS